MKHSGSNNRSEIESVPMTWWRDAWQNEMTRTFTRMPSMFVPHALQDWETEDVLTTMQRNMNRLMEDMFGSRSMLARWWGGDGNTPSMDLIEHEEGFVIRAELPGIDPDDVDVSISDHSLTVAGEKFEEKDKGDETYLCRECLSGSFSRTIVLPERADLAEAEASFENNILTVHVPKREDSGEPSRKLEVSSDHNKESRQNGNSLRQRPPARGRSRRQGAQSTRH